MLPPELNFTRPQIKVEQYFENLTALLINDDSFTTTYKYQPPLFNNQTYIESQELKRMNISLINTRFVSLKNIEQMIVTLSRPRIIEE